MYYVNTLKIKQKTVSGNTGEREAEEPLTGQQYHRISELQVQQGASSQKNKLRRTEEDIQS